MGKKDTQEAPQEPKMPPLTINAQYIKDLSFEHPNPVKTLQPSEAQPDINVNIDVTAQNIQESTFEVVLTIKADAQRDNEPLFISEIQYAGLFTLGEDLPKEAVHPVLMIECPRMLFPFARSVIANITREGGFPPLSLNPIDFAALYHQQMEEAAKKKA
ncbi:MAG: protein-export chaperone SecB [Alphaproteobacteria bacterium]|nr:protein-export chaperone SecB [Alphaproteobacteria bacterium]NCQ67321.1 protein-export chaperone SecB [Alphaproteobacteria bacterium]NCT06712.1 protein-export chaperone SecB [Alphaproteobacteria bacterium]